MPLPTNESSDGKGEFLVPGKAATSQFVLRWKG